MFQSFRELAIQAVLGVVLVGIVVVGVGLVTGWYAPADVLEVVAQLVQ